MGHIAICYLIFFATKIVVEKNETLGKHQVLVRFTAFVAWFIVDSLWFANQDMPFLRSRQMLCFPFGVMLAQKKETLSKSINQKVALIYAGTGIACAVLLVGVTQVEIVNNLAFIMVNILALGTCFVFAIAVLLIRKVFPKLIVSCLFMKCGEISYEIYLLHAFTLLLVENDLKNMALFVLVTYAGAYLLHKVMGMKNSHGRFNRCNTNKE